MVTRGIERSRLETARQLARRFHIKLTVSRQQEVLLANDLHIDMRDRGTLYHPMGRNNIRQILALKIKTCRLTIAVGRQALIPTHGVDIKVAGFNAPHQRVVEDKLLMRLAAFQTHQCRQGIQRATLLCR